MRESDDCRRIRDTYLDQVDRIGPAESQLFNARSSVRNYGARVSEIQNKIGRARAASSVVAGTSRLMGPVGTVATTVIGAITNAEIIAQLERELTSEMAGLAESERQVSKLEQDIRRFQFTIDKTPEWLARAGCDPL